MIFSAGGDQSEFKQGGGGASQLPVIITVLSCPMVLISGFTVVWKMGPGFCMGPSVEEKTPGVFLEKERISRG
jgi:hypothetical protein